MGGIIMSKIICKICGAEEESEKWIPQTKERVEKEQMCFRCLHWAEQHHLDITERGELRIRFFDGYETIL